MSFKTIVSKKTVEVVVGVPVFSWCDKIDGLALNQANDLSLHPRAFHHIALMPDCCPGNGVPIGSVIACNDAVIPNAVGVDCGCGMQFMKTRLKTCDLGRDMLEDIVSAVREAVPVGFKHHTVKQDWSGFDDPPEVDIVLREVENAKYQLGTLGGGNHFIEVQGCDDGYVGLMIHSGSRNFGYKIAEEYVRLANFFCNMWSVCVPASNNKDSLAFLPIKSDEANDYIAAMGYAMRFAKENRSHMMRKLATIFREVTGELTEMNPIDCHHNFARLEHHFGKNVWVHRKGAVSAREGETVIIPGSMGTCSYIATGLGKAASFTSCSHGAGRNMGRMEFCRQNSVEDCNKQMEGIVFSGWSKSRNGDVDISEAPSAYKDIDEVMESQSDLVEVDMKLLPLAVVKG
jgi:tRNA-splicing ligase RtcB (3'-phosphate/5'-hydroxy nucleic acid ligase)